MHECIQHTYSTDFGRVILWDEINLSVQTEVLTPFGQLLPTWPPNPPVVADWIGQLLTAPLGQPMCGEHSGAYWRPGVNHGCHAYTGRDEVVYPTPTSYSHYVNHFGGLEKSNVMDHYYYF